MRQTLFAAFRGEDGRSLARALVVLILVSLFAGGLNTGANAAAIRDVVLCAVDGGDAGSDAPAPHVATDCCIVGFSAFAMAVAATPPEAILPDAPAVIGARLSGIAMPAGLFDGRPRVRDPPLSI